VPVESHGVTLGTRGRVLGALAAGLLVAGVSTLPARAGDDFVPGSGSATASALQAGGKAAGLALTVLFGESATGYIGTAAQAASQTVDMGLLGTLLAAKPCDGGPAVPSQLIPQGIRVDSREQNAAAGKHASYGETDAGSPVQVTLGGEKVAAFRDPRGHSTTTMAAAAVPGVLDVRAATADTESGIADGATRLAKASINLGDVDLFGGIVKLRNLQWTAHQQTGKDATTDGGFSIGGAELGGQRLPTGDPGAVIEAISQVTSQVGVTLVPPKTDKSNGIVRVTPLLIHLQSSPTQQAVISPLLSAAQPIRQAVTAALTTLSCRFQTAITVADVMAGPVTGSGAGELGLGGVTATTEGTRFENPFSTSLGGGPSALPPGLGGPDRANVLTGSFAAPGFGTANGATATGGRAGALRARRPGRGGNGVLAGARSLPGSKSGLAVVIGFLALAGVLAVAFADWRRVRQKAPGVGAS